MPRTLRQAMLLEQASNIEPTRNITSAELYIIEGTLQESPLMELNKNIK